MKLRKLKKSKYPFLQLQILKLYGKKKSLNPKAPLKSTEILLNKIASILYRYHVEGKTIIFLGFPDHFSVILKNTKHLLVPEFLWFNGLFSNNISFPNNSRKETKIPKNIFKLMKKLKKKADLIVVYGLNDNTTALKESYLTRIPAITLSEKLSVLNLKSAYNSTGSYNFFVEKTENTQFFFSFIRAVLTKAKKKTSAKDSILPLR
jgi:hypothetical protein